MGCGCVETAWATPMQLGKAATSLREGAAVARATYQPLQPSSGEMVDVE
jgi:hypothetical protein